MHLHKDAFKSSETCQPQTPSYILDVCGVFLQITDSQYSLREKYFNYLL
ncbi:hypothetical protein ECEC1846_1890 [Escherichia coli EC1846]|uniref:Uncharacterized protein n=2 Tax=Escherichia coli TaxID=562 RepID=A0AAV3I7I3_ECOLX|nr:hypothetical protein ECH74115_1806 [Escherichia coli O157:H7 str. EC4115]AIG68635.1 hypothetical protein EDL933_2452 [Escherichia coli O157:H7 str. EDL933]AJA25690.1 hypothetical protein SS52_1810 [Escherichia coli O157:H7 str. SS52]AOM46452.1 hypothetical protein FORC28_3470 [Escherichia coli]EDU30771.1 hypothetical protein ECH7EC4196_5579 [Escherichia coli O157:H7 str. EC4196]EDU52198.1 hypothetical protein ECH7EC4113_4521 [Escherichia coli O157:H7 str. EC4113]EDU67621.1 hypothetical pro